MYKFQHKEIINEIVEEKISEEDRENTNNASGSVNYGAPYSNSHRINNSGGLKSFHFDDSMVMSENVFGAKDLLHGD